MPLSIKMEIEEKPAWLSLPRLHFNIVCEKGEDLELNPLFIFRGEYNLPAQIYFSKGSRLKDLSKACAHIKTIKIHICTHMNKPEVIHIRPSLNSDACYTICPSCAAFLELRSDYSDYIDVFQQVRDDLLKAWDRAVDRMQIHNRLSSLGIANVKAD